MLEINGLSTLPKPSVAIPCVPSTVFPIINPVAHRLRGWVCGLEQDSQQLTNTHKHTHMLEGGQKEASKTTFFNNKGKNSFKGFLKFISQ